MSRDRCGSCTRGRQVIAVALVCAGHALTFVGCSGSREARLAEASAQGNMAAVRGLLAEGANPNWLGGPTWRDGHPPLLEAIWKGRADVVRLLLAAGANPKVQGSSDPLDAALGSANSCESKPSGCEPYAEIVQSLIDAGADVHRKSREGTASNYATRALGEGKDEVVRVLLSNGLSLARDKATVTFPIVRLVKIDRVERSSSLGEVLELEPGKHTISVMPYADTIPSDVASMTFSLERGRQYEVSIAERPPPAYTREVGPNQIKETFRFGGGGDEPGARHAYAKYRTRVPVKLDREGEYPYFLSGSTPWQPYLVDVTLKPTTR